MRPAHCSFPHAVLRVYADLNVDGWGIPKEKDMPEQYSKESLADPGIYKHFFDTGKTLKGAGVRVSMHEDPSFLAKKMQLDQNFKVSVP